MRNSIDYPGERAPRRPAVIVQAGYTGQNHFSLALDLHPVGLDVRDILAGVAHEPHTSAPGRVSGV